MAGGALVWLGMAVAAGLPGVPPLTLPPKDRCFAATKEIFHTPMPRWVGGLTLLFGIDLPFSDEIDLVLGK